MAKQTETAPEGVVEPVLSQIPEGGISTKQLLELLAHMNADSSNKLAEAIIAAQKPYEDPKKEANEKMFREQTRRQSKQEREAMNANQAACPHVAGCNLLSEMRDPMGRTSIIWHTTDSTETIGICTNCQRIFRDNEPDYVEYRRKPSFNRPSASGRREYNDPKAARERARG